MTDTEKLWRSRTDEELIGASQNLADFTQEGKGVILAELRYRGLPQPLTDDAPRAVSAKDRPTYGGWRLLGYILDVFCGSVLLWIAYWFLVRDSNSDAGIPSEVRGLGLTLYLLLRDVGGASLGKILLRLEVQSKNGKPANVFQRILRNVPLVVGPLSDSLPMSSLLGAGLGLVTGADALWLLFAGHRLGDLLAQTEVIPRRRRAAGNLS
jgi:uncharacterized RDD family membrane protein YckC